MYAGGMILSAPARREAIPYRLEVEQIHSDGWR